MFSRTSFSGEAEACKACSIRSSRGQIFSLVDIVQAATWCEEVGNQEEVKPIFSAAGGRYLSATGVMLSKRESEVERPINLTDAQLIAVDS